MSCCNNLFSLGSATARNTMPMRVAPKPLLLTYESPDPALAIEPSAHAYRVMSAGTAESDPAWATLQSENARLASRVRLLQGTLSVAVALGVAAGVYAVVKR
jgi:hypothetical protein